MKKVFYPAVFILSGLIACNNPGEKTNSDSTLVKTPEDSLVHEIEEGHNYGMAKMGKLTRQQQQAQHLLDSINKLPAAAQHAAAGYRKNLDSLSKTLNYAEFAMNKWMEEFMPDSLINDQPAHLKYLETENDKVGKVKQSIQNGLLMADSLLRK